MIAVMGMNRELALIRGGDVLVIEAGDGCCASLSACVRPRTSDRRVVADL
jgi:hypothetical protein